MADASWSEARDLLRSWRENNTRKSDEVIYYYKSCLSTNLHKLGTEKYLVLEQVCIAALDCYYLDIASNCIKQLSNAFPGSLRVKKYRIMLLEADGRHADALKLLNTLIQNDKTNAALRKRRIALLKSKGLNVEAIAQLTEYLKVFMTDVEGWQELSELYLAENDLAKAAFCVEELILHNPHNHLLHQRYADIKYTQGGPDNIDVAKNYYLQALKLCPKNLRALYGLYLASSYLSASQKMNASKKKDCQKLSDWSSSKIKTFYKQENADFNIEEAFAALQI